MHAGCVVLFLFRRLTVLSCVVTYRIRQVPWEGGTLTQTSKIARYLHSLRFCFACENRRPVGSDLFPGVSRTRSHHQRRHQRVFCSPPKAELELAQGFMFLP